MSIIIDGHSDCLIEYKCKRHAKSQLSPVSARKMRNPSVKAPFQPSLLQRKCTEVGFSNVLTRVVCAILALWRRVRVSLCVLASRTFHALLR